MNKTVSGCVPTEGPLPRTTPSGAGYYSNPDRIYGKQVPCVNNTQVGQLAVMQESKHRNVPSTRLAAPPNHALPTQVVCVTIYRHVT